MVTISQDTNCGYVVEVTNLRDHKNADRLLVTTFYACDVIVDKTVKVGDIGLFFPSDVQLNERFCLVNNLVRRKDENGNEVGGYLDPKKRNVKPIMLRGEKSEGLYLPISCLSEFTDITKLKPGDTISVVNGEHICQKYIPATNPNAAGGNKSNTSQPRRMKIAEMCPTFREHVDTEQLVFHADAFHAGDFVEVTLKMHGTSQRTGYLPVVKTKKQTLLEKLLHRPAKTYSEYDYVTGTRRVVIQAGEEGVHKGGFYESDDWRMAVSDRFRGQLMKGETVYYEIVGFQGHGGAPIMGEVANSKVKNKEFSRMYGDTTVFSYGCDPSGELDWKDPDKAPCCECYIYRMTMTNEDGRVIEYPPDYVRYRASQMGMKSVMVLDQLILTEEDANLDSLVARITPYIEGADPIGKSHTREGVVLRIVNRPSFTAYKHKSMYFKILEGIMKDESTAPDMEEAQEVQEGGDEA